MAQSISQEAVVNTGLPGATAASRYAGATASGAPTTGTFAVGDFIIDQSGAMYVCTVAGTPGTWQLSGVSVNENIAGKNFVINGGMDIWQRGTSFATGGNFNVFTADRWTVGYSTALTVSRVSSGLTGFQYALRMQRNSGSSVTSYLQIGQNLESVNSIPMAGQTVTWSFWARAGANFSGASNYINATLETGTGTDQNFWSGYYTGATLPITATPTLTTSWQRFSYTTTIPSNATQIGFNYNYTPTGTAGANDYFDITGVQLEIAPQATPFSRAGGSIGGELALCQRYFYRLGTNSAYETYLMAANNGTAQVVMPIQFPVPMRTTPSVTTSAGTTFISYASTGTGTPSVYSHLSPNSCVVIINTTGAAAGVYYVQDAGSGNSYIFISAEL